MNNCRQNRSLFIEALYGELPEETMQLFEAHQNSCPDCSKAYQDLAATLKIMDKKEITEPEPVFWTGYWDRLADKLDASPAFHEKLWNRLKQFVSSFPVLPAWTFRAAAAMGILIIGIFIGRVVNQPGTTVSPVSSQLADGSNHDAVMTASNTQANAYLQKSKLLLLGLINFNPETDDTFTLNLPRRREMSKQLINDAAFVKDQLEAPSQQRLKKLISDLEVILIQIANLENEKDLSAIEMVKVGAEKKGILFKINLEEMTESEYDTEQNTETENKTT